MPGFTGAIGSFDVGPPKLATNVLRVGDPVKLTITITNRSDGPLARLVAPPPPQVREWQVFAAKDYAPPQVAPQLQPVAPPQPGLPAQPAAVQGVVVFNYTLIPLTETAQTTPPIPFSCFDPKTGNYTDLTIPPVPVTVKPGATPADYHALVQPASTAGEPEKELVLHGLAASRGPAAASLVPPQQQAWFPLIQLAPAAAFFGLWSWDRRRRYLEQHPDVLLRRRARRALHHQRRILRRAARAADAPRFAVAAVSAMRVACAPHYPAEPRALVGTDVLPLLPEPDRSGRPGEVVRRFFEVTDATRFGTTSPNPADLLPLQADLERVLQKLEEQTVKAPPLAAQPSPSRLRTLDFGLWTLDFRLGLAFGLLLAPLLCMGRGRFHARHPLPDRRRRLPRGGLPAGRRSISPIRDARTRLRRAAVPWQCRVATTPHWRRHTRLGTSPLARPLQRARPPEPPRLRARPLNSRPPNWHGMRSSPPGCR